MPRCYLYPGARAVAPELDSRSVSALLQFIERRYRARRFFAVLLHSERLPSFRWPEPVPVHNQAWEAVAGEGGEPLVSVHLGGERLLLRLRGGFEHRRQVGLHRKLASGELLHGELAIYAVRASEGDHRPRVKTRKAGGANARPSRVMVKMCAWLPREQRVGLSGTMLVRSDAESLLTYSIEGEDAIFRLNADHVRRWVAEHRERLFRTSEDLKREKRWPRATREAMVASREPWIVKHRRRLDSFTHEASAMLVAFAKRRNVAKVVCDFSDKGYVKSFPWHELKTKLGYKLEQVGIEIKDASTEAKPALADLEEVEAQ